MKLTIYIFFALFIMACSSSDDSNGEYYIPDDLISESQKESILNQKINTLTTVLQFGIQSDQLETLLKELGYFLWSGGKNAVHLSKEKTYGTYHVRGPEYPIESYPFFVMEDEISKNQDEPSIVQEFFYEKNDAFDNQPYYQVQISFDKVNSNSYESVRDWVLSLGEVTGSFQNVSDLDFVMERINQSDMVIELGEHDTFGLNDVVFVRFFDNRVPVYAQ